MNKIAVLIDFTEGCKIAVEQAKVIAEATGAEIAAVHFHAQGVDLKETEAKLLKFTSAILGSKIKCTAAVSQGDLIGSSAFVLGHIFPDLVIVGTHGIHGLKQHLFGAHILKLVQAIPFPCIVVQENTKVNPNGLKRLLFPVGPHPKYYIKTEQTAAVAKIFNSDVIQYEIHRPLTDLSEIVVKNMLDARHYFESENVKYTAVEEDSNVISIGYARQTLNYASENHFDLICVMADIPPSDYYLGRVDKENILTNPFGIPVLCCNK